MKIFLVRHGESVSDIEDRYGGSYDDHLTRTGIEQAKELAVKLSEKNIEMIFSSPLFRARETAEIIKEVVGCEIKTVAALGERNRYAHLTGTKKVLAKIRHPDEVAKLKSYEGCVEGGETYGEFRKRIIVAFDEIANFGPDSVTVVTHGGPISCIFRELLKDEFERLGHCAVFEIVKEKGTFRLLDMENAELEE